MLFPLSSLLIGYAMMVCVALVCSSIVFSYRMNSSITSTVLDLSMFSLARRVHTTAALLDAQMTSSSRASFTLEHTGTSASLHDFDSPLPEIDAAFQVLLPSKASLSYLAREEVWWNPDDRAFLSAGCYRYGTTCYRTNGTETHYVTSSFPYMSLDYNTIRVVDAPSQYYSLHKRMMSQPQFVEGEGLWTPQLARYTMRTDAIPCKGRYVEHIMAYYDCLAYAPKHPKEPRFPVDPELSNKGNYCTHAVVSIVDLMSQNLCAFSDVSSQSKMYAQSLRVMDEVHDATCTTESDETVALLKPSAEKLMMGTKEPYGVRMAADIVGDSVIVNAVLQRQDGIVIAYRDVTPKSFFVALMNSNLAISITITLVVLAMVLLVSCLMWYRVLRPLQHVCLSMKRTTVGILDDAGTADDRGSSGHTPCGAVLVKEVLELYETCNSLRRALSELKAFAPQGLFVTEADAAPTAPTTATSKPDVFSFSFWWEACEEEENEMDAGDVLAATKACAAAIDDVSVHVPARLATPTGTHRSADRWQEMHVPASHPTAGPSPVAPDLRPPPLAAPRWLSRATESATQRPPSPSLPLLLENHSYTETSTTSPLSPATAVYYGGAARLHFPVLTRTTSFRTVNCTTLTISYHYATANLEEACDEVQGFLEGCIDLILAHNGIVEVFRPEVLVISFGARRDDALHTKRALQCAVRIFSRFKPEQRKRASLLLDTGNVYVGTCGAHDRYARVLAGDRIDFILRVRQHSLSSGRIIATDSVALSRHTRKYVFLPFDNIVPRGGHGTQRSSTMLFQVIPKETLTPAHRQLVSVYYECFMCAVNGQYETTLERLRAVPPFDPTVHAAFTDAMQTILSVSPRRPRYCRFELPPFETLGFTVAPLAQMHMRKPLLVHDLEPPVPHVSFLSSVDAHLEVGASLDDGAGSPPHWATPPHLLPHLQQQPQQHRQEQQASRSALLTSGGCGASSASLDHAVFSSAAENFICGDPTPHTFQDSKGELWTLVPECVGRGAFSEVYKAFSSEGVIMAVKCIQLARHDVRMTDVVEEVNTSCQLWSEYIVNCTSWAHVGTYLFIVMELLAGGSLYDMVRHFKHGLSDVVARRYGSDVLRGLSYLHHHGIVHADVKPQNMLLATDGGCRVSDFGSSVTKSSGLVECAGDVCQLRGTPPYMSPEVARGEPPTMKSDVWSFGLSLYEVLTGQLPWVWRGSCQPVYSTPESQRASLNATLHRPLPPHPHHLLQPFGPPQPNSELTTRHLFSVAVHRGEGDGEEYVGSPPRAAPSPAVCTLSSSMVDCGPFGGRAPTFSSTPPLAASAAGLTSTASPSAALKTLSAPAFLQGVIRGEIEVHLDPSLLKSSGARQVVAACLRTDPAERPSVDDLLFMPFFYSS